MPPVSPLAPTTFPDLPSVAGVRMAAMAGGIRYKGRKDLLLIEVAEGSSVAGCLTRSLTASAPVDWCRRHLGQGRIRGIVVNSGNANAFTGSAGDATVEATAAKAAELLACGPEEIFIASTGVIGEPIPPETIPGLLPSLAGQLSADAWVDAAATIMTTDTFPKRAVRETTIGGQKVTLVGIAKGSGMIAPDMATMLGFLFTDAAIPPAVLQAMLTPAVEKSFNCITVDSDTSTSDTVLLAATGAAGNAPPESMMDPALRGFRRALESLCLELAHLIIRDGEGATKFVTIEVTGAASARAAKRIGLAIANSPLVKTALAAADANWGRIVMAVGKSGERADRDRLAVSIGGHAITADGRVRPDYDETPVAAHLKGDEVTIAVDVGVGRGRAKVWTCDLTHAYIDINASYRS